MIPYKAAYGSMPSHSAANPAIQQMYINGHFCYAYKFGIITNGLGIVRDITFYNRDFLDSHPDIIVEKKTDSPDEDKSLADSKALLPVFKDFLKNIPISTQRFSWAMPRLIPLRSTNTSCWKRLLKKPSSRLTAGFPYLNQTAP